MPLRSASLSFAAAAASISMSATITIDLQNREHLAWQYRNMGHQVSAPPHIRVRVLRRPTPYAYTANMASVAMRPPLSYLCLLCLF